ncbi:MAG: hypothetical protein AAF687_06490 [Pseudomonadota bacterium]
MEPLQILAVAALIPALAAIFYILFAKPESGNAILAAMLSAGFAAFTAVQIYTDGVVMFWTNHTLNLTGIQVWWDLVICVVVGLYFLAPRARAVGMNIVPWGLFVACTASIGLLAMVARLFWLENMVEAKADTPTKDTPAANPPATPAAKPAKA